MANTIIIKSSNMLTDEPTAGTTDIVVGELAANTNDGELFLGTGGALGSGGDPSTGKVSPLMKHGGTMAGAIDMDSNVLNNADIQRLQNLSAVSHAITDIKDEDNMSSNGSANLATQQSIKAYSDKHAPGSIIGYTNINKYGSYEIQNTYTVEDSCHKIRFKTPNSKTVEISLYVYINLSSTSTRIGISLSSGTSYTQVDEEFEHDISGIRYSDGEADDGVTIAKWLLPAAHLASIGSLNTFYIAFSTEGLTRTAYVQHGMVSGPNQWYPPMIIKATAVPSLTESTSGEWYYY